MSWKHAFSRSTGRAGAPLHFAAHSHHPWPDVTFAAHAQVWEDAAGSLDRKWDAIFGEIIPEAQRHIARTLRLPAPETIAFAPNTHALVLRILSCFPANRPIRVLTTDSEFHSFSRQIARLEEEGAAAVTRIAAEPPGSFADRFARAAARGGHDLVFFSDVFFNSGYWVRDCAAIVAAVREAETFVVIDGYHSFLATPADLSGIAGRAFYLAGGYKYAMAGEGVCFLHCPPGYGARPRDTGWFAEFGDLAERKAGHVGYARDASRFSGATFDPSGLYRLNAVMRWLLEEGLTTAGMLDYAHALQRAFVAQLTPKGRLQESDLAVGLSDPRGRFLTFRTEDAQPLQKELAAVNILTDARGDRLRIGFGIYHDESDLARLASAITERG
jgi:selenocysteine lyase/cysteine desulfurase